MIVRKKRKTVRQDSRFMEKTVSGGF